MTLARLGKWWSIGALICVIVVVVWSYASARQEGRYPAHHPWPTVSLLGGAACFALFGGTTASRSFVVIRLVGASTILLGAMLYAWSLL